MQINFDGMALGDMLIGKHFDLILETTIYMEDHIKTPLESQVIIDNYNLISSSAVYIETNPQHSTKEQTCGYNLVWDDYFYYSYTVPTTIDFYF